MRPKAALAILVAVVALIPILISYYKGQKSASHPEPPSAEEIAPGSPNSQPESRPVVTAPPASTTRAAAPRSERATPVLPGPEPPAASDKLQRLSQTRDYFRALAAGDRSAALQAVRA